MSNGTVEVRFLRSAPLAPSADAGPPPSAVTPLFAVFPLTRATGPCSF